jgi:hypothetical protein
MQTPANAELADGGFPAEVLTPPHDDKPSTHPTTTHTDLTPVTAQRYPRLAAEANAATPRRHARPPNPPSVFAQRTGARFFGPSAPCCTPWVRTPVDLGERFGQRGEIEANEPGDLRVG